jgi:hypothetical protein
MLGAKYRIQDSRIKIQDNALLSCIHHPISSIYIYILTIFCFVLYSPTSDCAVFDPLGNKIFEGSGESLYTIDATYGLIEGDAATRRSQKFREVLSGATYATFPIGAPGKMTHLISVGSFPTVFTNFTLSQRQSDAIGWSMLFPASRGRLSTFISKLSTSSLSNENQTITSTSDWYMVGIRGEANPGVFDVNVNNYNFSFPFPRIGIGYVNKYFTNYTLSKTNNPFSGVVEYDPPTYIYLRFRDGSPENPNGAKVYRAKLWINGKLIYNFIGGRETPGVLIDPGISFEDGQSRWVDYDGTFVYRFFIPNSSETESAKFELDIANDYIVEMSSDGQKYRVVLNAVDNIADESNRGWKSFYYGENLGKSTLGIDMSTTIWGVALKAERAWLLNNWQFPSYRGKETQEPANAWYIDANRPWGPLMIAGEYSYIGPFYDASDFIAANDYGGTYLDPAEPFLPKVATEDDLDGDGIKDWEDDFLLFRRDPPKFRLGLSREFMDFNNNGIPDNMETRIKPHYRFDYEEASKGYQIYTSLAMPFLKGLSLEPGYYQKSLILDKKSSRVWYALASFVPEDIPNFGTVQLRFLTKRAHDIIPDDTAESKDNLALQNSLSNIVTLIADYKRVNDLTLTTKFKYQYDADFYGRRRVIDTILINQIKYNINLGADTIISPAYRNDKTIGYTSPRSEKTSIDAVRQAYILQGVHTISEFLKISSGVQYLTYQDLKNPLQNYKRKVGFLELALNGTVGGKNMGMLASLFYLTHDLPKAIGGSQKSTNFTISLFLL